MSFSQANVEQLAPDQETPGCPVCGAPSTALEAAPNWGEWRLCDDCTLEFVDPFHLDETPVELYSSAYKGERSENRMQEFNDRLAARRAILHKDPTLWFWTPAFERTFDWLERRVGKGATVFEVGCGLGWVLHTLRARGFEAVGLDVAEDPVELNRADGFRVWHGTVDTVPEGWVEPDAIVSFFMLHHLPDPLAFARTLRQRFPSTPVSLAQYGPTNRDRLSSMPPRTLTRWNKASLETLLERAGYEPEVTNVAGTGNEAKLMRPIRKVVKRTVSVPPVYRLARRIEQRVMPRVLTPVANEAYVVHGVAEPAQT